MAHFRILITCFICFFIAACNTQKQTTKIKKTIEIKTVLEKISTQKNTTKKIRTALNLSIDKITIDHKRHDEYSFIKDKKQSEKNSAIFEILNKQQTESGLNLSGELFTNKNKLNDKEYLKSVDGVKINIEGNFD